MASTRPDSSGTLPPEPYHEIGASGEPAFGSGWSNHDASETSAGFYKDPLGVVHLKGVVSRTGGSDIAFTLPAGYRSSKATCLPTVRVIPTVEVRYACIPADGTIAPSGATDGTFLLDGMTFRAGAG